MKHYCPYCTHDIEEGTTQCPHCGYIYGPETRGLLKTIYRKTSHEYPHDRRKHARMQQKFKVTFHTQKDFVKHYLSDIGTGGLFINTLNPLGQGDQFALKILLPEIGEEVEVFCEVAWVREEERVTDQGTFPAGMGVKFVNPSKETLDKIFRLLRWSIG